jgi:hypothetical protein
MPVDQAIGKIADGLKHMENASQRNAVAMQIFGRGAAELIPLLDAGSEGIAKFVAEAKKTGNAFSREDAAKVEAANDAITRAFGVVQGAMNTLVVEAAPFIDYLANRLADFATQGEGLVGMMVTGFEAVVKGIAGAADYLSLLQAGFHTLEAGALWALYGIEKAIEGVLKGLDWLQEKLGGDHQGWGDAYAEQAEKLKDAARDAFAKAGEDFDRFANGEKSAKVSDFFDGIRRGADQSASAVAASAQASWRHGLGSEQERRGGEEGGCQPRITSDADRPVRHEQDGQGRGRHPSRGRRNRRHAQCVPEGVEARGPGGHPETARGFWPSRRNSCGTRPVRRWKSTTRS